MMNCSMGDEKTMGGSLTCRGRTPTSVVAAAVTAQAGEHNNPYQTTVAAVTSGGANTATGDAGFIRLSVSGQNIIAKSCHTQPCSAADERDEKTIAFQ